MVIPSESLMGNRIDGFFKNLILFDRKPVIETLETNHERWKKHSQTH